MISPRVRATIRRRNRKRHRELIEIRRILRDLKPDESRLHVEFSNGPEVTLPALNENTAIRVVNREATLLKVVGIDQYWIIDKGRAATFTQVRIGLGGSLVGWVKEYEPKKP